MTTTIDKTLAKKMTEITTATENSTMIRIMTTDKINIIIKIIIIDTINMTEMIITTNINLVNNVEMTILITTVTTTIPIIYTDAMTAIFQHNVIITITVQPIHNLKRLINSIIPRLHLNMPHTHTPHLRLLYSHLLCHQYQSLHIIYRPTKPLPYLACHLSLTKYHTIIKDFNTYTHSAETKKKGIDPINRYPYILTHTCLYCTYYI